MNRAKLMDLAEFAVETSNGRLRLAYNEEDESEAREPEAAHFLKLDGKRIGRDIELYGFMGDTVCGWQDTFLRFAEEVVFPLRSAAPDIYAEMAELAVNTGRSVYPAHLQEQWKGLFD